MIEVRIRALGRSGIEYMGRKAASEKDVMSTVIVVVVVMMMVGWDAVGLWSLRVVVTRSW